MRFPLIAQKKKNYFFKINKQYEYFKFWSTKVQDKIDKILVILKMS